MKGPRRTLRAAGCIISSRLGNRDGSRQSLLETAMQVQELVARAERITVLLKGRRETVAVAESSTGGLIAAALLGVGGASSYFLGGAVIYTQTARRALLDIPDSAMTGLRPSTEAYALLLGRTARPGRPEPATATQSATAASRSSARASGRSRSRPAAPTGSPTCRPSRRRRSISWNPLCAAEANPKPCWHAASGGNRRRTYAASPRASAAAPRIAAILAR